MLAGDVHPALAQALSLLEEIPLCLFDGTLRQSWSTAGVAAVAALLLSTLTALSARFYRKCSPDVVALNPPSVMATKQARKAPHRRSTTLPLLADTWDVLSTDPSTLLTWDMLRECARVRDEPLLLRVLTQPDMVVLTDPRTVEDVLKTHFYNFERGVHSTFFDLIGDSLLGTDGVTWQRQRRVFAKLFTPRMLRGAGFDGDDGVLPIIHRHAAALHQALQRYERVDASVEDATREEANLTVLSSDFAVQVALEIGFGVTMDFLDADGHDDDAADGLGGGAKLREFMLALERVESVIGRRLMLPPWLWKLQRALGIGLERAMRRDLVGINRVAMALIHRSLVDNKTSAGPRRKNIVSVFMDEMYADAGDQPAPRDNSTFLRGIAISFLIASHDSSAQTLSWVLLCIARHPRVDKRIAQELRHYWPPAEPGPAQDAAQPFLPSEEQLQQLVYLEATIRETMRLYPVVAFNMRTCVADTLLSDGTFVAKGDRVGLPTFAMGRSERIWGRDAHEFRPERWLEHDGDTVRIKHVTAFQYPVFHAGPRVCLGRHLAMVEMKAAAATVLASFRLEVSPKSSGAKYVAWLIHPTHEQFNMRVLPREDTKLHSRPT